jgi:DNA-binding CsgD family transcriptional regulator
MVVPDEQFRQSRFWLEWVQPQGFHSNLSTVIGRTLADYHALSFLARPPRPAFAEADFELLSLVAPHFRKAVKIAGLLEATRRETRTLAATLDKLALGAVAVKACGTIVYANAAAERELASRAAILAQAGALRAAHAGADAELSREIGAATAFGSARDIVLPRGGRREEGLIAHILPLTDALADDDLGQAARAVIFFKAAGHRPGPPARALAARFGLTPAELAVLLDLVDGADPAAIAAARGVKLSTVRTHLHRLFAKTGTATQAELMRAIAALIPDLAPA